MTNREIAAVHPRHGMTQTTAPVTRHAHLYMTLHAVQRLQRVQTRHTDDVTVYSLGRQRTAQKTLEFGADGRFRGGEDVGFSEHLHQSPGDRRVAHETRRLAPSGGQKSGMFLHFLSREIMFSNAFDYRKPIMSLVCKSTLSPPQEIPTKTQLNKATKHLM